ncbi:hypothetical protein QAD02_020576 [Eretmocerus hayati]|uniref:Uncharacterized protein n=1 Tax=Eretmocerus hayati TaxID=131215 RepID=A0ACC2PNU5_9HYME|nr:hypothetical protein QAD02_020576 [Eretmocerus hayati]
MFSLSAYERVKKCRSLKRPRSWSSLCSIASSASEKTPRKITSTISEATIKRAENLRCDTLLFSGVGVEEAFEVTPIRNLQNDGNSSRSSSSATKETSDSSTVESSRGEINASINIEEALGNERLSFRDKLQVWCLNNIFTLRNKAITELLQVLRDEGLEDLPKTAETLLKTKRFPNNTKIMETSKKNNGMYTYFGIKEVLTAMFGDLKYNKKTIEILVILSQEN